MRVWYSDDNIIEDDQWRACLRHSMTITRSPESFTPEYYNEACRNLHDTGHLRDIDFQERMEEKIKDSTKNNPISKLYLKYLTHVNDT
ncbi:hypothetical protein NC651_002476 [Populus alba x Populus x berolinensis]|nr:hypothetical protein NC651_002476 [Populus alba x Populus x berolinensis]